MYAEELYDLFCNVKGRNLRKYVSKCSDHMIPIGTLPFIHPRTLYLVDVVDGFNAGKGVLVNIYSRGLTATPMKKRKEKGRRPLPSS